MTIKKTTLCLLSVFVLALTVYGQSTKTDKVAKPKEWLSSYKEFAQEVIDWKGEKPAQTIYGIIEGQVVPATWEIMKVYGNQLVTWEAVYKGPGKAPEHFEENKKQGIRLELEFDKAALKSPTARTLWICR